jgi:hypothetical protein
VDWLRSLSERPVDPGATDLEGLGDLRSPHAICFQLAHLGHVDRHSNPLYTLKKTVLDLDGSPKDALGEPWRDPLPGPRRGRRGISGNISRCRARMIVHGAGAGPFKDFWRD